MYFLDCRGNQYVQVKVKVPTKLTPKQKELVDQIIKDEMASTDGKESSSTASNPNSSFTINQAWKRLKEFLNKPDCSSDTKPKDSKKKEKDSTEAKI